MPPPSADSESATYRYAAFVSYRHAEADRKAAVWLHHALETYRIPSKLAAAKKLPVRLGRVFRDEEELAASAHLSQDIEESLQQSQFLIVVCSPRTRESEWVNREIERFREMGRGDRILALLIEGEPAGSFPRALHEIRTNDVADEPLAADIRPTINDPERSRRRTALLRLIACIAGVRFDDLRQREQERRQRRLMQLSGVLAVLVLLIGGLAYAAWTQRNEAREQEGLKSQALEKANFELGRAVEARSHTRQALDDMVSGVTGESLATQKELSPEQKKFLESVVGYYEKFAAEPGEDREAKERTAKANFSLGHIYYRLGQAPEAVIALEKAETLAARLADETPDISECQINLAQCRVNLGNVYGVLDQSDKAEAKYRAALMVLDRLIANSPKAAKPFDLVALCHGNLGVLFADQGMIEKAVHEYMLEIETREKLCREYPKSRQFKRELATSRMNSANCLRDMRKWSEATGHYRSAQKILAEVSAEDSTDQKSKHTLAISHSNLGQMLDHELTKPTEANTEYCAAIRLMQQLVKQFPGVPDYRKDLARFHQDLGNLNRVRNDLENAETNFQLALEHQKRLVMDYSRVPVYRMDLASTYNNFGTLLDLLGKLSASENSCREAIELQESLVREFPSNREYAADLGATYVNLARLLRNHGNPAEALIWYSKGISVLSRQYRENPHSNKVARYLRIAHWGRAVALGKLGKHGEAIVDWNRVLELDDGSSRAFFRLARANSLARIEESVREATTEAEDTIRITRNISATMLFDGTVVFALASASHNYPEAEAHGARAVELLRQAIAKGYRDIPHIVNDPDLAPLRKRDDFAVLLWGLADMPAAAPK